MKRIVSLFLACAAIAACSETTAPVSRSMHAGSPAFAASRGGCDPDDVSGLCDSYPPPPPSDTSMYGANNETGETTGRVGVTYFYNKPANNGWVSFSNSQVAGIVVSPNAKLSFKKGVLSGQGTIAISQPSGKYVLDLSKAKYFNVQFNSECSKVCGTFGIISPERTLTFTIGGPTPGDVFPGR
jgi:hypothetical protein